VAKPNAHRIRVVDLKTKEGKPLELKGVPPVEQQRAATKTKSNETERMAGHRPVLPILRTAVHKGRRRNASGDKSRGCDRNLCGRSRSGQSDHTYEN